VHTLSIFTVKINVDEEGVSHSNSKTMTMAQKMHSGKWDIQKTVTKETTNDDIH